MEKKIKIAHFAAFCPQLTGQYATVKDMIKAERGAGLDAQFIATSVNAKKIAETSIGKEDGWLKTQNPAWARGADILVRHSCVPDEFANLGIPMVMSLHGRPESTFIIEFVGLMKVYRLICEVQKDPRYQGWITFWKEHEFFHKFKVPEDKLYYVPAMVDLEEYTPDGIKAIYKKHNGSPNIIVADMWRHDMTPYTMLYAAGLFKEKYCPTAKVHLFGVPAHKVDPLLTVMRKKEVLGTVMGLARPMSNVYRSGDLLITPHNIATRIVRESLACGVPIVAGSANKFTKWKADPRDIDKFAAQINKCWKAVKADPEKAKSEARETAEREFNLKQAGEALHETFETILRKESSRWYTKGLITQRKYDNYKHYQRHQISKLKSGFTPGKEYREKYRRSLGVRLAEYKKHNRLKVGMSVLCLGARDGTEVQAFLDEGFFAVGIDLQPTSSNFVLKADFQKIPYPDNSLDVVFMNCIDHSYDVDELLKEVIRVLKPGRFFIVDFGTATATKTDKWACCRWDNFLDIKSYIRSAGFSVDATLEFLDGYFVRSVCFRSFGGVDRVDIINSFIKHYKYKKYLEIGSGKTTDYTLSSFLRIKCKHKVGVDPNYSSTFRMTSDEYFAQCDEMFDVIFIDGLHTSEKVLKDIDNALKHLEPHGHIFLHDCNPLQKFLQKSEPVEDGDTWCGDIWKAIAKIRMTRDDLSCYVIDRDFGVGVIYKGGQTVYHESIPMKDLTWEYLEKNREKLLKLQEPEDWVTRGA